MLTFLKNHPFAVEAFFKRSLVLTFATPKNNLQQLIPPCLTLDTFNDEYAFITVAMVNTKSLRPKGFPLFLGNDFYLIGYRIFVTYNTSKGKRLRGLYILKSETNQKKMKVLGSIFTHYKYNTTDIKETINNGFLTVNSIKSNFNLTVDLNNLKKELPKQSPFSTWKEARRFAGPLPFTFTYKPNTKEVLIIEGVRTNWQPQAVEVKEQSFSFIDDLNIKDLVLANAFQITNVPYYWKKGKLDAWRS